MDAPTGGTSDDPRATGPSADASTSELVGYLAGHVIGRRWPAIRVTAGLAVTFASLGLLGLSVWTAVVPYHYERSTPPIGEVCFTYGRTAPTSGCFEPDQDALDQAFEDDMNRSNRRGGTLGALTSLAALALAWRVWRRPWKKGVRTGRRARLAVIAACLSPVAAVPLVVVLVGLLVVFE